MLSSMPVLFLPKEGSVVLGLLWPNNNYPVIYFSFCQINEMLLSHGYDVDEIIILEICLDEEANIGKYLCRKF